MPLNPRPTALSVISRVALAATMVVIPGLGQGAEGRGEKLIKVSLEFRQSGIRSRETVQGGGRVVITERGSVRAKGGLVAGDTRTRVQRSTGIFTIVRDGGESTLTVAAQVPYPQLRFYQDYAAGAGYVATGVAFQEVGTALRVNATLLPDNRVRIRLTPRISHLSAAGSGTIEFTEASMELVIPNGRPVLLGGSTRALHEVTRRILGRTERRVGSETTVVLTATIR